MTERIVSRENEMRLREWISQARADEDEYIVMTLIRRRGAASRVRLAPGLYAELMTEEPSQLKGKVRAIVQVGVNDLERWLDKRG